MTRHRTQTKRFASALLVALLATLVAFAASAQASSIVYVKRGDVWLAKSNGSGQRAITRNGTPSNPYRSPAYSDKGVITAVRGRRDIHFFNRRGKLIDDYRARFANPYTAAERGYIDDVMVPHESRPRLIAALETLRTKRVEGPKRKHGNIPL